jgi:hypothetical protein
MELAMKPALIFHVAFFALLFLQQSVAQPPPRPFSFQGVLTDTLGNPQADGMRTLRFTIYDVPGGGAELWFEEKLVMVVRGLFSVMLGDNKSLLGLDFSRPHWLGIRVDGSPEMVPRIEFSATGFSYNAAVAWNAGVADSLAGGRFTPGTVVRSLNSLTENITLAAGPNVDISRINDTLRISAAGGGGAGITLPFADSISGTGPAFTLSNTGAGIGLYGLSRNGNGVQGESNLGNGVTGKSSTTNGVYGLSSNESGFGMSGRNNAISAWGFVAGQVPTHIDYTGRGRAGLYGECVEASDKFAEVFGVAGYATSHYGGVGVYGKSERSYGVVGEGRYGMRGFGSNLGVYADADTTAVLALAEGADGVGVEGVGYASSGNNVGVHGRTNSPSGYGILGSAQNGGISVGCLGIFSQSGGAFHASPTTTVWTTNKPATVKLLDGSQVKLFAEESTELYFSDYGEGRLNGGQAHVELDPVFVQTVTIDPHHPMKVFVQLEDDCRGVYVTRKTTTGFDIVELQAGKSSAAFTYRVVCKRRYYEDERLANEKEDIRYNTTMLQIAWPEIVAVQKAHESKLKEWEERTVMSVRERERNRVRTVGK